MIFLNNLDVTQSLSMKKIYPVLAKLIPLIVGILAILFGISSALALEFNVFFLILFTALFTLCFSLISLGSFITVPIGIIGIVICVAAVFSIFNLTFYFINESFVFFANAVIEQSNLKQLFDSSQLPIVLSQFDSSYATVSLCFIGFLLSMILTFFYFKKINIFILSLVFSLVFIPLFILGLLPSFLSFTFSCCFLFTSYIGSIYEHWYLKNMLKDSKNKHNMKSYKIKRKQILGFTQKMIYNFNFHICDFYAGKLLFVCFAISVLAIFPFYILNEANIKPTNLNEHLTSFVDGIFDTKSFSKNAYVSLKEQNHSTGNELVMQIYPAVSSNVYLRSWVGAQYQDERWYALNEDANRTYKKMINDSIIPQNIFIDFFEVVYGGLPNKITQYGLWDTIGLLNNQVGIKLIDVPKKSFFVPEIFYNRNIESENLNWGYTSDDTIILENPVKNASYIANFILPAYETKSFKALLSATENYATKQEYVFSGAKIDNNLIPEKSVQKILDQAVYSEFVQTHYIGIPENLKNELQALAKDITQNAKNTIESAQNISDYLSQNYTYNLTPKKREGSNKEKDLVLYFIENSKEGFCSHFASAMVLLARSIGIPARYAEGYLINSSEINHTFENDLSLEYMQNNEGVPVYEKYAHAWAEVYIEGIGWLPFEPTASFNDDYGIKDTSNHTPTAPPPTLEPDAPIQPIAENPLPNHITTQKRNSNFFAIVCIILFFITFFLIYYRAYRISDKKLKAIQQEDFGLACKKIWIEIQQILKINKQPDFLFIDDILQNTVAFEQMQDLKECIQKTLFSSQDLRKEDYNLLLKFYKSYETHTLTTLAFHKKIYYMFIDCQFTLNIKLLFSKK